MSTDARVVRSFLVSLVLVCPVLVSSAGAQQTPDQASSGEAKISLDVVVTPKSGPPVAGLQRQDFTLLDNKAQQPITSFRAFGGSDAPIEVVLVMDTVNTSYMEVANEREQIDRFLRSNGGRMAHPTALAYFTDAGITIQNGSSTDGNALSSALDSYVVGLRDIRRVDGFYGAFERYQISIDALRALVAREGGRPGRKIVLWISPGWPLISGPEVQLDSKQQNQLFTNVVSLSTELRQAGVTLYSVDPLGASEGTARTFYYEDFLKGISKVGQADPGDLGLQVLAIQSGGLALSSSNDIAALIEKCLADTQSYYEISFTPARGERGGEYHRLEIRLSKPGLTARTRQGYYSQP